MQNDRLNRLALKAGFFYIVGQMFIRGLTFLITPILTRLLTQAQYGQIRVYESWLLIMEPVMSLCLWRSVDRAKYDSGVDYEAYVSSVHTLSYLSIAGFFILSLIFKSPLQAFLSMNDLMFYIAFLYVFAYTSILFLQRREKQMMRYKTSLLVTTLTIVPATLLSIVMIWLGRRMGLTERLVDLRVLGFYIPQIIGGFAVAILLWVQGRKFISKAYWSYAVRYSVPLIPEALSIQIMNQSDKIMIQFLIGNEYTGIFSLGTTISYIIWVIEDSVWNAFLPWMYEKISRDEADEIEEPWLALMHGFGLISWLITAMAPELVMILGSSKYHATVYLIAPMVTGTLFRFYSYIYTAVQNYNKKTQYVAAGTVGVMFVNIALNYICILRFGYMAAAYTTAFSYFLLLLLQGFLEKRVTGMRVTSLRKNVLIAVGYLAANLATMKLFDLKWYVRYAAILLVAAVAARLVLPRLLKVLRSFRSKKN
ncbi:MAG: oligosaccharide flippase family protein [Lachnospiraceae bacterium]|nr:oligosaccharide flippase family protein [Lachnospiraceae bacterium]